MLKCLSCHCLQSLLNTVSLFYSPCLSLLISTAPCSEISWKFCACDILQIRTWLSFHHQRESSSCLGGMGSPWFPPSLSLTHPLRGSLKVLLNWRSLNVIFLYLPLIKFWLQTKCKQWLSRIFRTGGRCSDDSVAAWVTKQPGTSWLCGTVILLCVWLVWAGPCCTALRASSARGR